MDKPISECRHPQASPAHSVPAFECPDCGALFRQSAAAPTDEPAYELRRAYLALCKQLDAGAFRDHPAASPALNLAQRMAYAFGIYDAQRSRPRLDPLFGRGLPPLPIGAKFTYQLWNEARQDWEPIDGSWTRTRFDTREEAERERHSAARFIGRKPVDLQVVPVWDDAEVGSS